MKREEVERRNAVVNSSYVAMRGRPENLRPLQAGSIVIITRNDLSNAAHRATMELGPWQI